MKVTLCGVITSLCVTLMFITNLIPSMTFAIPSIAGLLMICVVIEINKKSAFAVFFCTSIVSLFTVVDKEAVLVFIIFFGYYPIVKSIIESIKIISLQILIKFLLFNVIVITEFFISANILLIPLESFYFFGFDFKIVMPILANLTFILYDFLISLLVYKYIKTIHPRVSKIFVN